MGLPPTQKPVTLFSDTVRALLALSAPPRILLVTGIGAGDSRGHGGFLYDRLVNPLLLRTIYADKNRAEALLEQQPLGRAGGTTGLPDQPSGNRTLSHPHRHDRGAVR
jgi:hypothetical protein